jgi:hypothetical protein
MAKKSGILYPDCYNETGPGEGPDISGGGLYVSYEEVISMQLSTDSADLESSNNSRSGEGIMGGPAPGEPNPADMERPAEGSGRKA